MDETPGHTPDSADLALCREGLRQLAAALAAGDVAAIEGVAEWASVEELAAVARGILARVTVEEVDAQPGGEVPAAAEPAVAGLPDSDATRLEALGEQLGGAEANDLLDELADARLAAFARRAHELVERQVEARAELQRRLREAEERAARAQSEAARHEAAARAATEDAEGLKAAWDSLGNDLARLRDSARRGPQRPPGAPPRPR
jgi:hypothetical protein